jgi:uncharacterized alpha/beta hydrolase family protein
MKKVILLVVLIALVAFVSGAIAQQKTPPAPAPAKPAATPTPAPAAPEKVKLEKFNGAIEKVDEMAKAIDVKGKIKKQTKTLTFVVDDKTNITKAGKTMAFGDFKQGMHVSVGYRKEGDKMIAADIKIAAPKGTPKKAEEKPAEAPKK